MRIRFVIGPPLWCGALFVLPSCAHVSVDPIEVKPIHIVADINVKVERQLDDFFAFEKQNGGKGPATTQSVAQ